MPSLQDLPVEIVHHVLSYFVPSPAPQWSAWKDFRTGREDREGKKSKEAQDEEDRRDDDVSPLYNMCLVSKRYREIAQPLLFADFTDDGTLGNIEETVRFANCLYRYPELGQFVQDISIWGPIVDDMDESDSEDGPIPFDLTEQDLELYSAEIEKFNLGAEEQEKWLLAMEKCDVAIFAALIVNKTPNLRRLALPVKEASVNPFPELFHQNPSFLNGLESLSLQNKNKDESWDIADYQDFFALPRLKLLMLDNGHLQSSTCPSTWAPGSLGIEDFSIRDCEFDTVSLDRITKACKNIKVFWFDNFESAPGFIRNSAGRPQFNAADAHKALQAHSSTLEFLRLEFSRTEEDLHDWQRFLSSRVKMGPLRDFSALRGIRIQQAIVPVHPQFPPSLDDLLITDTNSSAINLVKNIAKDCKKGLYPALTRFMMLAIDVTRPIKLPGQVVPEGQTPEQAHTSLQNLFKDTKVDFFIAPHEHNITPMLGGPYDDSDDDSLDDDDYFEGGVMDALRALQMERDAGGPGRGRGGPGRGRGGPGRGRGGHGGGEPNDPIPPGLLELFMARAAQDPDFAHLFPPPGGR